jgi:hypothetical protein
VLKNIFLVYKMLIKIKLLSRIPFSVYCKSQISTSFLRKASSSSMNVFDRSTKLKQRNRTCFDSNYRDYEYVKAEIGYRVADRIFDIKRSFNSILDLGCQRGYVSKHLTKVLYASVLYIIIYEYK